jgi:phthalate 4,5-cis-dihydrodiol dehydrogenase
MFKFLTRTRRTAVASRRPGGGRNSLVVGSPDRALLRTPVSDGLPAAVAVSIAHAQDEHDPVGSLAKDASVDAIYLTSSRKDLSAEVKVAARAGKHILLEMSSVLPPAALDDLTTTCARDGVNLLTAHAHSYDPPYLQTKSLIDGGSYGPVRLIEGVSYSDDVPPTGHASTAIDQLYMQADLVRLLVGPVVSRVRLFRPTTGDGTSDRHVALFWLPSGAFASMTYGGTGRFNSDEWCGDIDRQGLSITQHPSDLFVVPRAHQHSGPLLVSCENADLRPMPDGVRVYEGSRRVSVPIRDKVRTCMEAMIGDLHRALVDATPPTFDGSWARDTLYVHAALRQSAEIDADVWLADGRIAQTRAAFPYFVAPT